MNVSTATKRTSWQTRIRLLWILLAALYVQIGKLAPHRAVSSVLIVFVGTMVVTLLAYILVEREHKEIEGTLLIALGAVLFVITNSVDPFGDYLGAAFGGLFAIMFISLLLRKSLESDHRALECRYFVGMCGAVCAGAVLFPFTLGLKAFLARLSIGEYYFMGPQGLGALCALCAGIIIGGAVLPPELGVSNDLRNSSRQPRKWLVVSVAASALVIATVFSLTYGERLVSYLGGFAEGVLVVGFYSTTTLLAVLLIFNGNHSSVKSHLRTRLVARVALIVFAVAAANSAVLQVASTGSFEAERVVTRLLAVEAPTTISVVGAMGLGLLAARGLASSMVIWRTRLEIDPGEDGRDG